MPEKVNKQDIINHLLSVEAWAKGFMEASRKTRKLIEADVSTSADTSQITDEHVIAAVTKFRQRLNKKAGK